MTVEEKTQLAQRLFQIGWDAYINEMNGYRAPEQLVEAALMAVINTVIDDMIEKEQTR